MKKSSKFTVWFTSLLVLGLSSRVLLFPNSATPTGLVTFQGEPTSSVALFILGLAVAGVLVFFVANKETSYEMPEELREDWNELSELEQEITKIK